MCCPFGGKTRTEPDRAAASYSKNLHVGAIFLPDQKKNSVCLISFAPCRRLCVLHSEHRGQTLQFDWFLHAFLLGLYLHVCSTQYGIGVIVRVRDKSSFCGLHMFFFFMVCFACVRTCVRCFWIWPSQQWKHTPTTQQINQACSEIASFPNVPQLHLAKTLSMVISGEAAPDTSIHLLAIWLFFFLPLNCDMKVRGKSWLEHKSCDERTSR